MAKYVPDIKTQRWVIIAPGRTKRPADAPTSVPQSGTTVGKPDDVAAQRSICVFCPGNEALTPPEVYGIGSGEKNKPGWDVRVVPNKFPITDVHEVIIHSPDHHKDIEVLPLDHVVKILTAYRDRYRAHEDDGQVLIFCNHGMHAGASLDHPHAQLVVVPKQINLDTLTREPVGNVVRENTYFVTYCPEFSQWPFETWIAPKDEGSQFGDTGEAELADLATVLQKALQAILGAYQDPVFENVHAGIPFGYNYYIYHGVNWYVRIIPRFIHRAGFELGTGLNVNVVDPSVASEKLKNAMS